MGHIARLALARLALGVVLGGALASPAFGHAVEIRIEQLFPGQSLEWKVSLTTLPGVSVSKIQLATTGFAVWFPGGLPVGVPYFLPPGEFATTAAGDEFAIILAVGPGAPPNHLIGGSGPLNGHYLGALFATTGSPAGLDVFVDLVNLGPGALDGNGAAIDDIGITIVPEPAGVALFALAALAFALRSRFSRATE